MLDMPAPYGVQIYYAMKANPNLEILHVLKELGVGIDASSGYEAEQAIAAGFEPAKIVLTSQQLAHNLAELVKLGVHFNATSLRQLEIYGKSFPGSEASIRINPGIGSGHSVKVNVGGPTSSFGIWHEYIPQVHELLKKYNLTVKRMHTHIGSGSDPQVWQEAARISLELIKNFPDAEIINLGGGFKIARVPEEHGADMSEIGKIISRELTHFAETTGRQLKLELEPGHFMVGNIALLIARIDDITDTGPEGYTFIKLNTGMNDFMRPAMYGSQHPIAVLSDSSEKHDYVVVGHNCESADLLTPAPGDPEVLMPRTLNKAEIDDFVLIGGVGGYSATMSATDYNGFPSAKEVFID